MVAVACAATVLAADCAAQRYPVKPVRMVVPFSAGSGSDMIARIVAGGITEVFGQQLIIENRAGAAGNIGAELVARAAPDGYTVLFGNIGHAANVTLYQNLQYDFVRDFTPVTQLGSSPAILVVHPSLPVKSLAELVKLAKQRPGAINYASGGTGTPTFLAAELFKRQAGVDLMHVPYRAGGEALTSILSGETSVYFAPLTNTLPLVKQGKLRPLGVTSLKRVPLLPEYPTVAELGYPGYQSGFWHGLLLPAKASRELVNSLRAATLTSMNSPAIHQRLIELAYVPLGDRPEDFAAHVKSEIERLGSVLRGIRTAAE